MRIEQYGNAANTEIVDSERRARAYLAHELGMFGQRVEALNNPPKIIGSRPHQALICSRQEVGSERIAMTRKASGSSSESDRALLIFLDRFQKRFKI
jgi:hypothetical protein